MDLSSLPVKQFNMEVLKTIEKYVQVSMRLMSHVPCLNLKDLPQFFTMLNGGLALFPTSFLLLQCLSEIITL